MLSNVFNACSVLSPARAEGAGPWCSENVTTITKVKVSKAALTLFRGFLSPCSYNISGCS